MGQVEERGWGGPKAQKEDTEEVLERRGSAFQSQGPARGLGGEKSTEVERAVSRGPGIALARGVRIFISLRNWASLGIN